MSVHDGEVRTAQATRFRVRMGALMNTTPEPRGRREARRVTVTGPTRARSRPVIAARELAERTPIGDLYLRSLMRSQLALSLGILTIFVVFLAGVPLLFSLVPSFARTRVLRVPVVWLVLGLVAPVLLLVLAAVYNRFAERNEGEFVELVGEWSDDRIETTNASREMLERK
jgi:uncharacterized membrane protein (DUF485 family)